MSLIRGIFKEIMMSASFSWPVRHLPILKNAGNFPMIIPGCNNSYRHETVALHLHDYPGEVWIGGKHFRLQPGDITLSPSGVSSRYALPSSGSHLCIHFTPHRKGARQEQIQLPYHKRLGPQTTAARERFWRIIDHARQAGGRSDSPAGCAASAALQEFLLWLHMQNQRSFTPRRGGLVEQALAKLDQAIEASLSKPLLIGELAAHVGMSAEYVARLFAKRNGMTLQHYLLQRRIELARHLLISSDLKIVEIGLRVGIPDPQYFNKQFRRVVGRSPLAYRLDHARMVQSGGTAKISRK